MSNLIEQLKQDYISATIKAADRGSFRTKLLIMTRGSGLQARVLEMTAEELDRMRDSLHKRHKALNREFIAAFFEDEFLATA